MKKSSIVVIILLILVACIILMQFAGTYEEYSRYNTNWNGTSDFFTGAQQNYVYDYADLAGLQDTILLIIAPSAEINDDAGYLRDYISRGNTVIIADQEGVVNKVLATVGSDMQISGIQVNSAERLYDDSGLFTGYVVENGNLFGNAGDKLFLNYPSYVTGGIPMLTTSVISWVDEENNPATQKLVDMKVYSLAAYNTIGNGKVVVIADPSIFINSMQSILYKNNMEFLNRLQTMPDMYLEQKFSSTASGGGIFGLLPFLTRYPVVIATLIVAFSLGCAVLLFRHDRKRRG